MHLLRRRVGSPDGPLLSAGLQEKDLSVLDALRDSGAACRRAGCGHREVAGVGGRNLARGQEPCSQDER
jgi:hypothetical protein